MNAWSTSVGAFAEKTWEGVGDTWQWLRGVVFGEWEDNRSTGQIVTDALIGFVPGLGSIVTLRDLLAVIFRLAKHPEKREDVSEWILLIAMLLPLIMTVLGTAVGAVVGALAGGEIGGFVRAVALFLVLKHGIALRTLVDFLRAHGYGDVVAALRQVKFAKYQAAVSKEFSKQVAKLQALLEQLAQKAEALSPQNWPDWMPAVASFRAAPARARAWIAELGDLGKHAEAMIPKALIEMDQRLGRLLAGNIKAATQTTHQIQAGIPAPSVVRAEEDPAKGIARNVGDAEPGNTRRLPEKRLALAGKREYTIVDEQGRPVGAVPYDPSKGDEGLLHKPLEVTDWKNNYAHKVDEGYPDLAKEFRSGEFSEDYATFTGTLRPATIAAGSDTTLKRIVSWDKPQQDVGAFANRELPPDGEAMRADSAIKEDWNSDGECVEIRPPDPGDPVWKELHARQIKDARGADVPYKEELKVWEGPASSQTYQITREDGSKIADEWQLPGGKDQVFMDRDQLKILKKRSDELQAEGKPPLISSRKKTNFPDFDASKGNIVPKGGPAFEVIPLSQAQPHPSDGKANDVP